MRKAESFFFVDLDFYVIALIRTHELQRLGDALLHGLIE
jgi:hypothetical protein